MNIVYRTLSLGLLVIICLSSCAPEKVLSRKIRKEKFNDALAIANKKIAVHEARKRPTSTTTEEALPFYIGVGRVYRAMGEHQKAEAAYRKAALVAEQRQSLARGKNQQPDETELELLDELAEILLESGNYNAAGVLLEQTLAKRSARYGKNNVKRYRSNLPYGQYLMTLGKYDDAYNYLKDHAMFIRNKIYNTFNLHDFDKLAEAYEWLARLEFQRGNIDQAKYLAYKNLKYQDHRWAHRLAGKNNLNRIESLNLVARCEIYEGNYPQALNYSDQALSIYNDVLNEPTIHKVNILLIRADLLWKTRRFEEAFKLFHEANEIQLKFIRENLAHLTEYEQANFARQAEDNIQFFYRFAKAMLEQNPSLANSIAEEVFNVQVNTKAKLLDESSKRISALANDENPEIRKKFEAWRSLRYKYARLINIGDGEEARKEIDITKTQIDGLEKELSLLAANFSSGSEMTDWKSIAAKLEEDEVAIETIRIKNKVWANSVGRSIGSSYLFLAVTRNSTAPNFAIIHNGDTIENRLFRFYTNSKGGKTTDSVSYNAYFEPIRSLVGNKSSIYFSADGIYNFVNLSILMDKDGYLLDKYKIMNATNTRNIRKSGTQQSRYQTATLFGRPQYGDGPLPSIENYKESNVATNRAIIDLDDDLPDLPGTEWEIKVIEKLLAENLDVTVKLRSEATEEAIKNVTATDIIHVATHGFFINDSATDPMLASGLLFSGATSKSKDKSEDGLFTAYEAAALNLSRTSLVVLSACETGLGEIKNGEGVYGLQRAFEIAGARNILMSLWKIDDVATVMLMEGFYRELIATKDPATALRRAQDAMRKSTEYAHPYYWGAFKLVGE